MIHRQNNVLLTDADGNPDFAASYTVLACPVGAVASAASSGSTATVDAGHGFAAADKMLIYDGTTSTFVAEAINSVTGTTIVWSSATPTIAKSDLLVNLGPDTSSSGTPAYDASPMFVFTDADGNDAITNSLITTDTTGNYDYWTNGDGRNWELVRDASGTVAGVIPGWSGVGGRLNGVDFGMVGDDSTDNQLRCTVLFLASTSSGESAWPTPSGTFQLDSQVTINANLTMLGDLTGVFSKGFSGGNNAANSMFYTGSSAVSNVHIDGIQMTTSHPTSMDGGFMGLRIDDGSVKNIVIDRYGGTGGTGGRGFTIAGSNTTYSNFVISNPADANNVAAIRVVGGDSVILSNMFLESGDDMVQFVPSNSGNWANLDIINCSFSDISGYSTKANACIAHVEATCSSNIFDCSMSNVQCDAGTRLVAVWTESGATGTIKRLTVDDVSGTHDTTAAGSKLILMLDGDDSSRVTDVHVSRVRCVGTTTALPVGDGLVQFNAVQDCSLTDSYIDGSTLVSGADAVIFLKNSDRCRISDNHDIRGNVNMPMFKIGGGAVASSDHTISNNQFTELGSNQTCFDMVEGTKTRIFGNKIKIASGATSTIGFMDRTGATAGAHIVRGNDFTEVAEPWNGASSDLGTIFEDNDLGLSSQTSAITAGSTQTQAGATALTSTINIVDTVGTAGDGVALPSAKAGMRCTVVNNAAVNGVAIWPASGDQIHRAAVDAVDPDATTGAPLAIRASRNYYAKTDTIWYAISSGT